MGNMSKRQLSDQRAKTAEGHQWIFNTAKEYPYTDLVCQLAPE